MTALNMSPVKIRNKIARLPNKRPVAVRRHFINLLVERQANDARASAAKIIKSSSRTLIDRCHHADYRRVIPKLPDRSVKLFVCDPPYGDYRKPEGVGGYVR
jgi:hypothetical protein